MGRSGSCRKVIQKKTEGRRGAEEKIMEIKSRVCSACKEMNNPDFTTCWKCHQSLDQAQLISSTDDLKSSARKVWEMAQEASLKTYMLLEKGYAVRVKE